jgi:hypothetical protein
VTTFQQVIDRCRWDYLNTGPEEAMNRLAGVHTATTTTLTLTYALDGISRGSRLSVGLEDMYVWDINAAAKTVTVQRAWRGSTATTHADLSSVYVNTRPTDSQIGRSVNDELAGLSARLFQIKTVALTYNASVDGYDLTGVDNLLSVYRVRYQANGSQAEWPTVDIWEHSRNLPTTSFASGQAIFVRSYVDPGRTLLVEYRAPFDELTSVTDDVLDESGLHTEAHDLLALGAACRLTAGREVQRARDDTQGSPRRAQEVPSGANMGAYRGLQAQYQLRLGQEIGRLQRLYPNKVRI